MLIIIIIPTVNRRAVAWPSFHLQLTWEFTKKYLAILQLHSSPLSLKHSPLTLTSRILEANNPTDQINPCQLNDSVSPANVRRKHHQAVHVHLQNGQLLQKAWKTSSRATSSCVQTHTSIRTAPKCFTIVSKNSITMVLGQPTSLSKEAVHHGGVGPRVGRGGEVDGQPHLLRRTK